MKRVMIVLDSNLKLSITQEDGEDIVGAAVGLSTEDARCLADQLCRYAAEKEATAKVRRREFPSAMKHSRTIEPN